MAGSLQTSVQDQMADVTECSICTEIFTDPKSLPCLHSFCLICLEKYGKDKKPGDEIACPICRNNFVIPKCGFCTMPNNFFIGKMVEIRKLSSTTINEALCATCPEKERVKAKMFCFECEQNLCERCGISHKKIKLCQNHQVLEIGNKPQEVNSRNSYCDQHPGELVKMYCEVDKTMICIICFAESHQTHKCLSVTKASEKFSSALKYALDDVKQRLGLPECKDSLEKLKNLKTDLLAETTAAEQKILNEATRLKALIDSHANVLMQKLTASKDKKLKEIESVQQDVERFQATIESYTRYSNELLNKGAPGDICREANQMKKRAREVAALPGICCGCDGCWDKIIFKSSNLEDVLRLCSIANAIGSVHSGLSRYPLLGHDPKPTGIFALLGLFTTSGTRPLKRRGTITVQNIPAEIETDILLLVFESHLLDGGETAKIDNEKGRGTALVTFKDSAVADALASKGSVSIWGNRLLIKRGNTL